MTSQQGEKLEHENQFKAALSKYRFSGSVLEQLRKSHPDWQPAIVEYRGRKVSESILRVQDKAGTQESVATSAEPVDETAAPPAPAPASPSVQIAKEKKSAPSAPVQVAKEKVPIIAPSVAPVVSKPAPTATPNEVAMK